jgi:hypothetical protein
MRYTLVFLGILAMSAPILGKSYLGDTTLSSKKFDQLTILGVAKLDTVIAKEISITGPLRASNITADTLSVIGPATLAKGTVPKILITGAVSLTDVTSDTVTITGFSDFTNVTVNKNLEIIGMLKALNSRFNSVILTMSESVITDSSAKAIVVKRPDSDAPHQTLSLYGNTHVDTVEFESGHGEIHVYGKNVTVGNVKGAEVIQH